ncbi:MAG: hypothetical protein NVSMB6_19970 [Burkholderiaceae bacterium]
MQYADASLRTVLTRRLLRRWVSAALLAPAELTVRLVNAEEGRALNHDYRGKDYATNVLTFPYPDPTGDDTAPTRADIVLCCPVLEREAAEQGKPLTAHAAHLVVHGALHAQGYDHEVEDQATEMEQLETGILAGFGVADPYQDVRAGDSKDA